MNTEIEVTHQITANAPTTYQLNALRRFHLRYRKPTNFYGIFDYQYFYCLKDAQNHLILIAEDYFEDAEKLDEAINGIYESNSLTIDGVTAKIEELCEGGQE